MYVRIRLAGNLQPYAMKRSSASSSTSGDPGHPQTRKKPRVSLNVSVNGQEEDEDSEMDTSLGLDPSQIELKDEEAGLFKSEKVLVS